MARTVAAGLHVRPGLALFSVIMPTYDYAAQIGRAISSVLAQSYDRWELIVIADGCTDETAEVVEGFADPRIRLIELAEHAGNPGLLRNIGAEAAGGDVICYLDHDDWWEPAHLADLVTVYREQSVRLVATGCRRVSPSGQVLGMTVPANLAWHPELQVVSPIFEPSRVSHRGGVLPAVGGWSTSSVGLEDWDLWLRLADAGEHFTVLPQRSVKCTLRPESRRHSLAHRYLLTFGPPVDAATAQHVMVATEDAAFQQELGSRYRADVIDWYHAMAATGELRLPRGMSFAALLAELRAVLGSPPFRPHIRPHAEGYVLCRVLSCRTREHAQRIVSINQSRMPRSSAYLQALMAGQRDTEASR